MKDLIIKLTNGAAMTRWNDKLCPVELTELDKQAHKMIIAYVLSKFEEENNNKFDWIAIIEGGIFEFLQRLILTDLKPQLFHKIKNDRKKYNELNKWVYKEILPLISPLGKAFCQRYKQYFMENKSNLYKTILEAAHFYATKWEFNIIERANPDGYEINEIKTTIRKKQEQFNHLKGIQQLGLYSDLQDFIDLCGELRYQIRWSHLNRMPKTSVLGHMLIVAILSYLFTLEIEGSRIRCINNYFTGLFHDLPEVLTRDVINPVKRSVEGLDDIIKDYEYEEMEERILSIIPAGWVKEIKFYTENEFSDVAGVRDGSLVKAADTLTAFTEAYLSIKNGIGHPEFRDAFNSFLESNRNTKISGLDLGKIYREFDENGRI